MKNYLSHFREPTKSVPLVRKIIYSLMLAMLGLQLGIIGKQFDTETIGGMVF